MFLCGVGQAQHTNTITATVDYAQQTIVVQQEIIFRNTGDTPLNHIVLNDWNNAYSSKDSPLARRFTDEFLKAFHLAKDSERGFTLIQLATANGNTLQWSRPANHPDIVDVKLHSVLTPNESITLKFSYSIKIPADRFTHFGYDAKTGTFTLRDWYLTPARLEDGNFITNSNENLDDIANAVCDYNITLNVSNGAFVWSDLYEGNKVPNGNTIEYYFSGKARTGFNLSIQAVNTFETFRFPQAEVLCNLKNNRVIEIQRAATINQVVNFVSENLGTYPLGKIMVTQADYERNPVYGLNQLPAFISPFPDSFMYEVRFLKTYLNAYLKNTLKLDPRKDNWVYDAIQVQLMINYIKQYYPEQKMMGALGYWWLLKSHHLFEIPFNEQYNNFALLMARRNSDQPIGNPKSTFIKFNEQIAGKYKAGISYNYLNEYLGNDTGLQSLREFYSLNTSQNQTNRQDLQNILQSKTHKDVSWFFNSTVNSRDLIDYRFGTIKEDTDSLTVEIKNVTGTKAPIPLYGINKSGTVFKYWIDGFEKDTVVNLPRLNATKLVLNHENIVPEYNQRNNYYRIDKFFPNNRPVKLTFFQDLENPAYNQMFYVPNFIYNLYDGFSQGIRFHNKSMLEKPFIYEVTPTYSMNTGELIGGFSLMYNQYLRDNEEGPFNIRYYLSGSTYHYTPDASYRKFVPSVQFRFRDENLRKNKRETVTLRQIMVEREKSAFVATQQQNESYSVFNARYAKSDSEITKHYNFYSDVQIANAFGKLSGEFQFRRLFNDNRQVNIRVFAGMFMYRSTQSEFFSFGLDRPTDYLFDYNYYGRSEETGLFSQQFIMAEGGFKSKLDTRFANQWMTTINTSFNVWNWIELYGDAGLLSNKYEGTKFVYDSGIRLNLVTDYFELYFPVYSSNGFEPGNGNYSEKIRFVVTIAPSTLLGLFTRRWF
ncbi:aminopeptidase [Flavobacterium akiainvivens]|uniref:Aminopeptidase n=1 Tax=Flavobacterium akiainvivens TaxID=1202724 RepID=A0A0N0RR46_9FLAO|nr:aminopeptidase [Flavobacterium akiainvivens]